MSDGEYRYTEWSTTETVLGKLVVVQDRIEQEFSVVSRWDGQRLLTVSYGGDYKGYADVDTETKAHFQAKLFKAGVARTLNELVNGEWDADEVKAVADENDEAGDGERHV